MTNRFIILSAVATAALSNLAITPAFASSYDDQIEETRALNIQALEAARDQNNDTFVYPGRAIEIGRTAPGLGGPYYQSMPEPDDFGDEPVDEDNEPVDEDNDESDSADIEDMPPPQQ